MNLNHTFGWTSISVYDISIIAQTFVVIHRDSIATYLLTHSILHFVMVSANATIIFRGKFKATTSIARNASNLPIGLSGSNAVWDIAASCSYEIAGKTFATTVDGVSEEVRGIALQTSLESTSRGDWKDTARYHTLTIIVISSHTLAIFLIVSNKESKLTLKAGLLVAGFAAHEQIRTRNALRKRGI